MSPRDAIYQACLLRFRPIMMTTACALLGGMPLALGFGVGSELRQPLGIAIVGGLIVSQMLTLFTTPVIYLYLDRFSKRFSREQPFRQPARDSSFPAAPRRVPIEDSSYWKLAALLAALFCSGLHDRPEVSAARGRADAGCLQGIRGQRPVENGDPERCRDEGQVVGDFRRSPAEQARGDGQHQQPEREAGGSAVPPGARHRRGQSRELLSDHRIDSRPSRRATPATQSGRGFGGTSQSFSLPFTASWEPDLWGRVRLSVENAVANAQVSAADLENARLSAQALLATDYFLIAGTDMQQAVLKDTIEAYQKNLQLTINRFNGGVASKSDVTLAQTQLLGAQAQSTDLRITRAQDEHAIAVLTGQPPSAVEIPVLKINGPPPPIPDRRCRRCCWNGVRISPRTNALVAAANANIGIAQTAYYPTLTLSASAGFLSPNLQNLFTWAARTWSAGPSISETLFDFGRRGAQVENAQAAYDATVAAYRQTVLSAFQEVEDDLASLRYLAEEAPAAGGSRRGGPAVSRARNRPLQGGNGFLPERHHDAGDRAGRPADRCRHSAAAHDGGSRSGQGDGRRLGRFHSPERRRRFAPWRWPTRRIREKVAQPVQSVVIHHAKGSRSRRS